MSAVSKESYLKRYLSKKKKKQSSLGAKLKPKHEKIRIVDDDVDVWKSKQVENKGNKVVQKESSDEEAPVIAEIVDERPWEVKVKEVYHSDKWKTVIDVDSKQDHDEGSGQRNRHDSDSDSDGENSRRDISNSNMRNDSDSDHSPTRVRRDSSSDQSPVRQRADSEDDQSPARRKPASDDDQSPVRRRQGSVDSDQSPVRKRQDSDSDQSPARKRLNVDDDQSPPRQNKSRGRQPNDLVRKRDKTLAGTKAGLQKAEAVREEIISMRRRDEQILAVNAEDLGKDAVTQFRKSARMKYKEDQEKKEDKAKKEAILKEKYSKWNQGLKQKEMQEMRLQTDLHEISKPLARYEGDADLERHLKEKEDIEDPMYEYMKKKKQKLNANDKSKVRPMYKGPAPPPARFNIPPGYRWDGVDRSNGFEKKIILQAASKTARNEEAYKWSIEDM